MMATTPMGTAVCSMTMPGLGVARRRTCPTGSGRSIRASTPSAIPWMRSFVSSRRSIMTVEMVPSASAQSAALAAKISSQPATRASAMARRAWFFTSVLAVPSVFLAS